MREILNPESRGRISLEQPLANLRRLSPSEDIHDYAAPNLGLEPRLQVVDIDRQVALDSIEFGNNAGCHHWSDEAVATVRW
jgi:hypothetical protein